MTKIEEILEKYKSKTDHYADQDWYDENVEKAMIEYGEWYGKKCLETAAENAKLSVGTWVHPKGYPYLMVNQNPYRMEGEDYFYTDQKSITNIQLPEHD